MARLDHAFVQMDGYPEINECDYRADIDGHRDRCGYQREAHPVTEDFEFVVERHLRVGPRMHRRFPMPRGFMTYNSDTRPRIEHVTDAVQVLAQTIGELVPVTQSQELALVALEEVQMRIMRAFEEDS